LLFGLIVLLNNICAFGLSTYSHYPFCFGCLKVVLNNMTATNGYSQLTNFFVLKADRNVFTLELESLNNSPINAAGVDKLMTKVILHLT
jgi:hypothetical protein